MSIRVVDGRRGSLTLLVCRLRRRRSTNVISATKLKVPLIYGREACLVARGERGPEVEQGSDGVKCLVGRDLRDEASHIFDELVLLRGQIYQHWSDISLIQSRRNKHVNSVSVSKIRVRALV